MYVNLSDLKIPGTFSIGCLTSLSQGRREMSLKKMFLAGAAVVGGLAGYALARTMDEVEKMEEADLENVKDIIKDENDNVGDAIKSSSDTIVERKETKEDMGEMVPRTAKGIVEEENDRVGEFFKWNGRG